MQKIGPKKGGAYQFSTKIFVKLLYFLNEEYIVPLLKVISTISLLYKKMPNLGVSLGPFWPSAP